MFVVFCCCARQCGVINKDAGRELLRWWMSDGPVLTLWVHCGSMSYCGRTLCCLQAHQIISPATVRVGLSVYYDTGMIDHMWQCFRHIERYNIMYNICRISKKAQVSMTVSWTAPHKAYKCSPDSQTHKITRFFKGDWLLSPSATKTQPILITVYCICKVWHNVVRLSIYPFIHPWACWHLASAWFAWWSITSRLLQMDENHKWQCLDRQERK